MIIEGLTNGAVIATQSRMRWWMVALTLGAAPGLVVGCGGDSTDNGANGGSGNGGNGGGGASWALSYSGAFEGSASGTYVDGTRVDVIGTETLNIDLGEDQRAVIDEDPEAPSLTLTRTFLTSQPSDIAQFEFARDGISSCTGASTLSPELDGLVPVFELTRDDDSGFAGTIDAAFNCPEGEIRLQGSFQSDTAIRELSF